MWSVIESVLSNIYHLQLYKVVILIFVPVVLWIILSPASQRIKTAWKVMNILVLAGILTAIVYTTLLSRGSGDKGIILIPFYSFYEAQAEKEMYRSMLMNVFLYVPVGISVPNILPEKIKHKILLTVLFALLFSASVEVSQLAFGLGRCEADDVITNTLGAFIGSTSFIVNRKLSKLFCE